MKIKVAFYRGKGGWVNKIIRWWTKSPYSHAELVMPDDETWIGISPFKTSKLAARTKPIIDDIEWDYIEIEINENQKTLIEEFFQETEGCRYDWVGMLLSQIMPYHIKCRGKWYCSEWIAYALRISNVVDWRLMKIYDRADLSPAVLYEIITASQKWVNFK